jgi:hypothetical protein
MQQLTSPPPSIYEIVLTDTDLFECIVAYQNGLCPSVQEKFFMWQLQKRHLIDDSLHPPFQWYTVTASQKPQLSIYDVVNCVPTHCPSPAEFPVFDIIWDQRYILYTAIAQHNVELVRRLFKCRREMFSAKALAVAEFYESWDVLAFLKGVLSKEK